MGRWVHLVALFALAALSGCVAEGTDFEALPFVAVDKVTRGQTHTTVPIGFSAYDEKEPRRVIHGPGGGHIDKKAPEDQKGTRLSLLYPLVTFRGEGREHDTQILTPLFSSLALSTAGPVGRLIGPSSIQDEPFVYPRSLTGAQQTTGGTAGFPFLGYDRVHLDPGDARDGTKRDYGFLPFFMGGDWPLKGKYLAIAPFGGTTYGFLGKDEMHWYGFPYPFYLYSREQDTESRHVLFPFVNWIEGGGHEGFRVLPFYAHYRKTSILGRESYDRTWIMWPFISWAKNATDKLDPETREVTSAATDEFFVFPFYGSIVGPDVSNHTVLWPFFRYESVESSNFWELRAPFPFFIMHHGSDPKLKAIGKNAERTRFDIWPLVGVKSRPGFIRHFVLWPIERYESRDDDYVDDTKFYLTPFLLYHSHREKASQDTFQHTRVWPFMLYRRSTRGDIELHMLAPILWNDPQGFERIYFPFFRLYEYKESASGGYMHRVLLGLASWRSEPKNDEADGYKRLSLLFGLFQYRSGGTTREESKRSGLRLFYLPEITWGGDS